MKTRALLRLARRDLSDKSYRRENRRLCDIGREMSAGRDAAVMVEVDALAERFAGQLLQAPVHGPRSRLAVPADGPREDVAAGIARPALKPANRLQR